MLEPLSILLAFLKTVPYRTSVSEVKALLKHQNTTAFYSCQLINMVNENDSTASINIHTTDSNYS